MRRTSLLFLIAFAAAALPARAQGAPQMNGCGYKWAVDSQDARNFVNEAHTILIKDVHIDCNEIQLFADQAELFTDLDRMTATGNVVFVSSGSRIAAERMERWRMVYVPPFWAHRSVNTGNEPLVSFCAYNAEAGHNYGDIETEGFVKRVLREGGQPVIR